MQFVENPNELIGASTDAGNVSYEVPVIHPSFAIGTQALNHTAPFVEASNTEEAHKAAQNAGKALAFTVLDLMMDAKLLQSVKEEFNATFGKH